MTFSFAFFLQNVQKNSSNNTQITILCSLFSFIFLISYVSYFLSYFQFLIFYCLHFLKCESIVLGVATHRVGSQPACGGLWEAASSLNNAPLPQEVIEFLMFHQECNPQQTRFSIHPPPPCHNSRCVARHFRQRSFFFTLQKAVVHSVMIGICIIYLLVFRKMFYFLVVVLLVYVLFIY